MVFLCLELLSLKVPWNIFPFWLQFSCLWAVAPFKLQAFCGICSQGMPIVCIWGFSQHIITIITKLKAYSIRGCLPNLQRVLAGHIFSQYLPYLQISSDSTSFKQRHIIFKQRHIVCSAAVLPVDGLTGLCSTDSGLYKAADASKKNLWSTLQYNSRRCAKCICGFEHSPEGAGKSGMQLRTDRTNGPLGNEVQGRFSVSVNPAQINECHRTLMQAICQFNPCCYDFYFILYIFIYLIWTYYAQ